MAPTKRQLEVARAVIDCGSFNAAAARLSMSQVAVSRHVAALEKRFGATLFMRERGAAARLSPAGEDFAAQLPLLLAETRTPGEDKIVRIVCDVVTAPRLKADMSSLYMTHSDLDIELRIASSEAISSLDRDIKKADLVYLSWIDPPEALEFLALGRASTGVFASPDCDEVQRWAEAPDLHRLPLIGVGGCVFSRPPKAHQRIASAVDMHMLQRAPDFGTQIALARRAVAAAWAPNNEAAAFLEDGELVDLCVDAPPIVTGRIKLQGGSIREEVERVSAFLETSLAGRSENEAADI